MRNFFGYLIYSISLFIVLLSSLVGIIFLGGILIKIGYYLYISQPYIGAVLAFIVVVGSWVYVFKNREKYGNRTFKRS